MTTTASRASDPPAQESKPPATRRRSPVPRIVWAGAALLALALAAAAAGLWWAPIEDGLPDAGRLVVDGIPLLRLVTLLTGGLLAGFGLSAIALDPAAKTSVTRSGRIDLGVAATGAFVLAGASMLFAVFTLADVLGVGLGDLTRPVLRTYLWDVEVSRAHMISAVLAVGVGIGLLRARSLGAAAAWYLMGLLAVGIPSLTGHASGLGTHSLALVSGFVHAIAAAVWGGGLVALATHALRRSPSIGERVRRFGVVSIGAVGVLAVTGFASAATRMDSFAQLVTTAYGRTVLAKIIALLVAGGLGLLSRRANQSGRAPLRGRLLAEAAVLGSALGVAVVLARSDFPGTGRAAEPG